MGLNPVFSQKTALNFIHDDWKTVLEKAKTEKKFIFMDAYTSWCGPCKQMSRTTFADSTVIRFFNENFINAKMDMEAGDGPALGSQYGVQAYPTLLFADPNGKIVHRAVGFHDAKEFLALGKIALDQNARLSTFEAKYADGERKPTFLKDYALKLIETFDERAQKVAEEYLATQQDWSNKENLPFVFRFSDETSSPIFAYFVKNKAKFYASFGKENVETKILNTASDKLMNEKTPPRLDEADSLITLVYPDRAERFSANYRMVFYRMRGDRAAYAESAVRYFSQYFDSADELSETALTFTDVVEDEKMLKKALVWAKKAQAMEPSVSNQLTIAKVYQRLGKDRRARKAAEKALKLGRENGEPITEVEEFLKTNK